MELNVEHAHWYWLAAGVLLAALEALAPGAVLIWFGLAAIVTGLVCLFATPGLSIQFLLFGVLAIGMTVVFKYWQRRHPPDVPRDAGGGSLNQAGSQYIGLETTLASDIVSGHGRVKVADTSWRCTGPSLPAGTRVRIIAVESGTLKVEAID